MKFRVLTGSVEQQAFSATPYRGKSQHSLSGIQCRGGSRVMLVVRAQKSILTPYKMDSHYSNVMLLPINLTRSMGMRLIEITQLGTKYLIFYQGLVIFNPAVGGSLTGEGGSKFLKNCLSGMKKLYIRFEGVEKFPNNSKLYIIFKGGRNIFIFHARGIKNISQL